MSEDLIRLIIVSVTGGLIGVVIVKALTYPKGRKRSKGSWAWIIPAGANVVQIAGIMIFVHQVILPGPKREWKLKGTVLDGRLHRPVESAEVTVVDFSCSTDKHGNYSIRYDGLAKPEWRIKVTSIGYDTVEQTATSDTSEIIILTSRSQ